MKGISTLRLVTNFQWWTNLFSFFSFENFKKYITKYNNYFYYLICTIHEYRNSLKSILYIHSKSLIWWHTFFLCSIVYKPAYTIQGIQWKASLVPKNNTEPLIMKSYIRLSYLKITRSMFIHHGPELIIRFHID